ncbi:hypothetical protein N780_17750 [Pontibacillus chungwhensis BH030062]|uniref:Glycosyltransferase 2-like domain-containing protein n=1 Tax=Pontibacillus chungwhensis BH030062 TaxID=1385513 RepID=A0A0A2UWF5_9BACI|nr:glycosyltransferase [Pontibacillus chungwhensis]KGP91098.1 hypothetical protein N780_17750 [Pontibacillus chungwhensis BH030062]
MDITVVTAVYNGEEYLKESIDSILNQTFTEFEYIIVNDGSHDHTKMILDKIQDSRVKVIHLKNNGGAANALNIGIQEAKGKWIAIQDADDVSVKHRLEKQIDYVRSHPQLVAVGSSIECITGKEKMDESSLEWEESFFNNKVNLRVDQFFSTPLCHGSGFYLKEAHDAIGGYDPMFKIAYDYDLWTRMFDKGDILKIPEVLYKYRVHGDSLAHSNKLVTTNEVLISTFKNISKIRYAHLNRKPNILFLGTESNIKFYQENLKIRDDYLMMHCVNEDNINKLREIGTIIRSGHYDGVILSVSIRYNEILRFLIQRGFSYTDNLFKVWMP